MEGAETSLAQRAFLLSPDFSCQVNEADDSVVENEKLTLCF